MERGAIMTNAISDIDQGLQKWALLIGINQYPKLPRDKWLSGCVNDVNAIEEVLSSELFGFPREHILKLTNHDAMRDGILRAFREHLVENPNIRSGDVVVVYYSGHGSHVKDMHRDEEDGLDETIVPYDSGRGSPEDIRDITDDEISALLDDLTERTQNVNLFLDSCHSGTITRAIQDAQESDAQGVARWVEPWLSEVPLQTTVQVRPNTRGMGPSDWLPLSQGYVLASGCKAHERSREYPFPRGWLPISREWHGAFTFYLLEALNDVSSDTTYYDIWDEVRAKVASKNRWQNPQIEGAFERKVFGGAALPRKRYVEVVDKNSNKVTVAAGLVHGATVGSRFAIYREHTQIFEDETARIATINLVEVGAFASVGEVERGEIGQVGIGAPAVAIEHDYGTMQMVVQVLGDEPILGKLREEIETSRLLVLANEDQPSTATVLLRRPLLPGGSEDDAAEKSVFILSSGDGHPLVEAAAPSVDPAIVRDKLEHIARYTNILAIKNIDGNSKLRNKVKLQLLRVTGQDENGHDLTEHVERSAGGEILLTVGDRVILEVDNLSGQPLHVIVLDCDTEWQVRPIFPPAGAIDDVVQANQSRRTNRFWVNLPEHQKPVCENRPFPQETVKVIATTERVDFRSLWLPSLRDDGVKDLNEIEGGCSSLYHLIELATDGSEERATRSLEEDADPVVRDWTTAVLVFHITT
jgi:hypothetical protein